MTPPTEPRTAAHDRSAYLIEVLRSEWDSGRYNTVRNRWSRMLDETVLAARREAEAAAPLREALRDVLDHSIPQHSSACAAQDEDDDCICETGPLMDRAYAALAATPAPAPPDGKGPSSGSGGHGCSPESFPESCVRECGGQQRIGAA